jgi:hypothetical protein
MGVFEMELKTEQYNLEMADITGSKFSKVRAENLSFDNVNLARTVINNANMSELSLNDVNLSGTKITEANMSGTQIKAANMSHVVIDYVLLFGAEFQNIILPEEDDDHFRPNGDYKPIVFNNCNLTNSQVRDCDLSNMVISNCNITGLRINGILIEELMKNSNKDKV